MTTVQPATDEAERTATPTTTRKRSRPTSFLVTRVLPPLLVLAALIAIWELASKSGQVNEIILPPPSEVFTAFIDMLDEAYFWEATQVTMTETLVGFVIGVVLAWALGTLIGTFDVINRCLYPLIVGFQITPRVALAPVFLTWFGFGLTSKIVMAATICFFPVLLNVVVGMQTVDKNALTLMRSMGAGRRDTYMKLVLPSSLPLIFAGIKNAITLALIGAIVAEFVGASKGMGVLIKTLNFQLDVASSFAVVFALMIFGLILYWIVEIADARIVYWRSHV